MSAEAPGTIPEAWSDLPLRELLRRSQTNVTPDPEEGYHYAAAAYDRAQGQVEDPTAAGEAAAKASFRAVQLGLAESVSDGWVLTSLAELTGTPADSYDVLRAKRRERIATLMLAGRGRALRLFTGDAQHPEDIERQATHDFEHATSEILYMHVGRFVKWDPYAPMLSWQHATFEAARPSGDGEVAIRIATSGLKRAWHVQREEANGPMGIAGHYAFRAKQWVLNLTALHLAEQRQSAKPDLSALQARAVKLLG